MKIKERLAKAIKGRPKPFVHKNGLRKNGEEYNKGGYNCGFTYTDPDDMKALIVTGPTSSGDEFLNTFVHEIHHLAVAIADSVGVDLDGEKPAYIAGDAAMELAQVICHLGCSLCN